MNKPTLKELKYISATVDENYTDDDGIDGLEEGSIVMLCSDGTWCQLT